MEKYRTYSAVPLMPKPCVRVPWMESLVKWNHAVSFSSVIAEPLVPENGG